MIKKKLLPILLGIIIVLFLILDFSKIPAGYWWLFQVGYIIVLIASILTITLAISNIKKQLILSIISIIIAIIAGINAVLFLIPRTFG